MTAGQRNYDYFQYSLPQETTDFYAQNALSILSQIKYRFPQFYESFRCPSEILTLSGVRSFDTYYDLGEDAGRASIDGLKALLKSHGILLLEESSAFSNQVYPENRYSLLHIKAFNEIPDRYKRLPDPGWNQPNFERFERDQDFFTWWLMWQQDMLTQDLDNTCKAWLANDSCMAHNMTFGMLLGYPGEAICSALYETEEDALAGNIVEASIKHAAQFDGAQPIYSYSIDIADHYHIIEHQKLWSEILDKVYYGS